VALDHEHRLQSHRSRSLLRTPTQKNTIKWVESLGICDEQWFHSWCEYVEGDPRRDVEEFLCFKCSKGTSSPLQAAAASSKSSSSEAAASKPVKEQKSLHIHDSYNLRKLSIDGNFPLFTLPAGEVLVLNLLISSSWSWRRLERQTQKFSLFKNSNYRRTTADYRIEPFQQKRERYMT